MSEDILETKLKSIQSQKNTYIIPENIKKGIKVLGVEGTLEITSVGIDTSDATATADDITSGKTAYTGGTKINGTNENNAKISTEIKVLENNTVPCIYGSIIQIPMMDISSYTNTNHMFYKYASLTTIPKLDTSNVTDMSGMFRNCTNLTTIPKLDTSNVTNMSEIFWGCSSLTEIPLLDTSKVTNMFSMFSDCTNLTTIPVLDTSNVTNMEQMFNLCDNLSDDSLNNILVMCINATSYTGTKTLSSLFLSSVYNDKITSLSNYEAFIKAGWTTGY